MKTISANSCCKKTVLNPYETNRYKMLIKPISRFIAVSLVSLVALGCATKPPSNAENICAIFKEKRSWAKAAKKVQKKWGVPTSINMAFIYQESGFQHNAKPPRKKLFGFIPTKRISSSRGYSQALKGTWELYQRKTGNADAKRKNFADSINFIGWYNHTSSKKIKIGKNDPYNLYLAYHEGWGGYKKMAWAKNPAVKEAAKKVKARAKTYAYQLRSCTRKRNANK